ncbi:hypothetical protein LP419_19665 [Massilia sp. H-1]|nr:hypothetical protein LP419_19665 [Massilia sp. H-1]
MSAPQGLSNVERVHGFLTTIEQSSALSEQEIGQIMRAARAHVSTTGSITEALAQIRDSMLSTDQALPRDRLGHGAGGKGGIDCGRARHVVGGNVARPDPRGGAASRARSRQIVQRRHPRLSQITREALFDRRYTPIPHTDPPKHRTRFDAFTDRVLPDLQDGLLAKMPQLAYAGAVDNHGYFPDPQQEVLPAADRELRGRFRQQPDQAHLQ